MQSCQSLLPFRSETSTCGLLDKDGQRTWPRTRCHIPTRHIEPHASNLAVSLHAPSTCACRSARRCISNRNASIEVSNRRCTSRRSASMCEAERTMSPVHATRISRSLQWGDPSGVLMAPCPLPGLFQFFLVPGGPLDHKATGSWGQTPPHYDEILHAYQSLGASVVRMEVRWPMLPEVHPYGDPVEPADLGHQ